MLEAKESIDREKLNDIIRQLCSYRYDYKDKIPEEIVSSVSKDRLWKVRSGWFLGIFGELEAIKFEFPEVHDQFKDEIDQFIDLFDKDEFKIRLTTENDIRIANEFLDKLIPFLEST